MTHAYRKDYLEDTMPNLGGAFQFAKTAFDLDPSEFMDLFISSGCASFFDMGNCRFLAGMSGAEIVVYVLEKHHIDSTFDSRHLKMFDRTPEYWTGWILAFYHWYSGKDFEYIHRFLPANEVRDMYHPLHEASEGKFCEVADRIIQERDVASRLKEQRMNCGMTQRKLSEESGVNLRTIQQYENRSKDIRKASGSILMALSKTLHCRIETLLQ